MSKNPCERKCWTCGNVAMHADDVAPDVCCQKCGSQDTRRTKPSAADQKVTEREEFEQIGQLLARCSYVELDKKREEFNRLVDECRRDESEAEALLKMQGWPEMEHRREKREGGE